MATYIRQYDINYSGRLTKDDFQTSLRLSGISLSPSEVEALCQEYDRNRDGVIEYRPLLETLYQTRRAEQVSKSVFQNYNALLDKLRNYLLSNRKIKTSMVS